MNRDDIIKLAGHREVPPWVMKLVQDCVEAERETCAKVADDHIGDGDYMAERISAAIRARGEQ